MPTKAVNTEQLTRAAITYNNVLRELPFFAFNEVAKALRLNILKVHGKDIAITARRRAGILRPYIAGMTPEKQKELVKFFESKLEPELTYAAIYDNITNYRDKNVLSNQGEIQSNQTKKHPLELLILMAIVRSYGEDVIFSMFFAERDTTVKSPMTSFNGFFPKLDMLTVSGEIDAAKNNLKTTGVFNNGATPGIGTDGKNHYDRLVAFIKSSNPLLRATGEVLLYAAENPVVQAREGLREKMKYFAMPDVAQLLEKLRSDCNAPGLNILSHLALGTGDKLMLAKPGLFDFGVDNESDDRYVQVRNPFEDPNEVQFWIQAGYDTRIIDVHEKVFCTNEQTNTALDLAGDYRDESETVEPEPET